MTSTLWQIERNVYKSHENRKFETIFTLANGYRGLRGSIELSNAVYRGNFIAGVFDKSSAQVTEIVNCQDPTVFEVYIGDEHVCIDESQIIKFNTKLCMDEAVLITSCELKLDSGKVIKIESERFVSRHNVHRWASRYIITPVNFSGDITVYSSIDGAVTNKNQGSSAGTRHFKIVSRHDLKNGIAQKVKTIDRGIEILEASKLEIRDKKNPIPFTREYIEKDDSVKEACTFHAQKDESVTIYKLGATYTSRDTSDELLYKCKNELFEFENDGYGHERDMHVMEWKKLWQVMDIEISGDDNAQRGIRFNLFQLASSAYDGDEMVSIGAKGLHGEGYKGHIFWDTEIFMLPFFIYTNPKAARSILMYRYNMLNGARKNALQDGFKGARFPWESADDGTEITPEWGIDYDGKPMKIWTGIEEYHINADVVFAIWEYYRATHDRDFMINYGLEIFFDTALFWSSRLEYNEKCDRYELTNVIGPDEFHEHVKNNAYTNYLAKWNLKKAFMLAGWIREQDRNIFKNLCLKLDITADDIESWEKIQDKIYIPKDAESNLIEQFEGYFKLKDVQVTEYDENGMPLWPYMDGYNFKETQLVKQADVVMLMLLLNDEFSINDKRRNYEYYEKRTMHKSSLSPSMYSIMGLWVGDTHNAYSYFIKTIMADLDDNQGNTELGLHAASAGGAWQCAVFGFGGFNVDREGIPNFNPWIPENWNELRFKICWRGSSITVKVTRKSVAVETDCSLKIRIYGKDYSLTPGNILEVNSYS